LTAGGGGCSVGSVRSDLLSLAPGEVHVWLATPEDIADEALLTAYAGWMNQEEAARQGRFLFMRHRHQFLVARALVRTTLSRYADVGPRDWRFVVNGYGRPDIDPEHGLGDFRFNLSHTDGLVAVAVARGELGVDVEDTWRRSFFDLWTLKEAYIKARGMGLAISLHRFAYDLDTGPAIALAIDPELGDSPQGWQFFLDAPTDRHRLALAVRFPNGEAPRIGVTHVVPGT
jgi:4'-phosphopantetheinyl transferase